VCQEYALLGCCKAPLCCLWSDPGKRGVMVREEQAQEWSDLNSSSSDETYDNQNLSRFLIHTL
jgi:hypothetical protein